MYLSVVKIVYGVPFNSKMKKKLVEWSSDENSEHYEPGCTPESLGFTECFHGNYDDIAYCGVAIGEIVENDRAIRLDKIKTIPNQNDITLAEANIAALPDYVKEQYNEDDLKPRIWLIHTDEKG